MAYEVKYKVFFITGGAAGIGAEIVKFLVAEDAKSVVVFDINETDGIALKNELNSKYGEKVEFIKGDVTKENDFVGSLEKVEKEKGLDVLINNAGIADESWENYKKAIQINMMSVITGTLHALRLMRKDEGGNGGAVINIASVAALTPVWSFPTYSATKSAVLQFSNCIGKEEYYSRTAVRVMTVCPGRTDTAILGKCRSFEHEIENNIEEVYPLQTADVVGRAVVDVFKNGSSGSTWLIQSNKPVEDITADIGKAYETMYDKAK